MTIEFLSEMCGSVSCSTFTRTSESGDFFCMDDTFSSIFESTCCLLMPPGKDCYIEFQSALFHEVNDSKLGSHFFVGCGDQINSPVKARVFREECLTRRVGAREGALVVERPASKNLP